MKDLSRILTLIEGKFRSINILVIGDVMLDRYVWGSVDRISPEAPGTGVALNTHNTGTRRRRQRFHESRGFGCTGRQAGFWGDDLEQRELDDLLSEAGIDISGMTLSLHPTISKTRVMARQQQLLRMDMENLGAAATERARCAIGSGRALGIRRQMQLSCPITQRERLARSSAARLLKLREAAAFLCWSIPKRRTLKSMQGPRQFARIWLSCRWQRESSVAISMN